ncbi:hypothetical protein G3I59_24515 [Amycolatopsis rubida]|uniref:Uncharacterized protein n=1 Tax=Amycolatopsis rubida TaxID=112413 RepID=A0A1I6AVK4_9PSEU|nr:MULTISPECIES: hypothetical protein [Amycolatopsis]MYW93693.1 hypothetical protein [Amycolatopsis rubida]NEC58680.1 hypothetical protein [Amycolatopsis rubida]OAP21774.1 hypothetical protein A4R44_07568 [Amycolatopsis sp. M39]SFQ72527.1 hypothetical protein SAMN05421854_12116 [Amycolatopsis rubida]
MSVTPNRRALAMLRAIAAGRAELTRSCEPDLRVDGLPCCDQTTAHDLVREGLVRPVSAPGGAVGQWTRAELTPDGQLALGA